MKTYGSKFDIKTKHGPLVFRQALALREKFPNSQLHLCVGANYNQANKLVKNELSDFDIKLIENHLWKDTSEIESLRQAMNTIIRPNNLLIVSGDLLFDLDALNIVSKNKSQVSFYEDEDPNEMGLNFNPNTDNKLNGLSFNFTNKWTNLIFLVGDELELAQRFLVPKNRTLELWQLLEYILKYRGSIFCRENHGFIVRATSPDNLNRIANL
jgi:hypothetical protein